MTLKDCLAVTGLPGLYRLKASRPNGIIATDIGTGKSRFISNRKHRFTPLESIGIYKTDGDTEALSNILNKMRENADQVPADLAQMTDEDLRTYMASLLPDYDPDLVKPADIRKLITWYHILTKEDQ